MTKLKKLTALLIAVTMLCALAPAIYASPTANTRHTNIPGWTVVSSFSDSDAYIDNTTYASGSGSLAMYQRTPKANDETYLRADTTVAVKKGKTYRLQFKAKSIKSTRAAMCFDWVQYSLTPISDTYDWTEFKFLYNASDDVNLNIRFLLGDKTEGFWVDEVKFYDISEGEQANLITNGEFDTGAAAPATSSASLGSDNTPADMTVDVYPATKTIDGDFSDWEGVPIRKLERVEPLMDDLGEMISANIRFSYDEENLYLAVDVTDSNHVTYDVNNYWNGDSFQWCQGYTTDTSVVSRGIEYFPDNGYVHQQTSDFTSAVKREGNKTYYEVAMPWNVDFADNVEGVPDAIRFNAIVNNNNGDGRAYALEINEGITVKKDITKYLWLKMWQPVGNAAYRTNCPTTAEINDSSEANVYLANPGTTTEKVQITAPGYDKYVELAPGKEGTVSIPVNLSTVGVNDFDITLSSADATATVEYDVLVYHNAVTYEAAKNKMDQDIAMLKELLYQCEKAGITTDYETAYYTILARQIETMEMEVSYGVYDRIHEYEKVFNLAVPEIKKALEAYLAGEKEPFIVPKYTTGNEIEFDGTTLISNMDVGGKTERRPMFLTGYIGIVGAGYLPAFFQNIGANYAAMDIEWRNVVKDTPTAGWFTEQRSGSQSKGEVVCVDEATNNYAIRMNTPETASGNNKYFRLRQTVAVEPGATYEYGFKVKGNAAGTGGSHTFWFNPDGFAGTMKTFENSSDWKEYYGTHTVPLNDNEIDYTVFLSHNVSGDVYMDDFYLRKVGTTENMINNGDFQEAARELNDIEQRMRDKGWYIDRASVDYLEECLARAEENNVLMHISLSPHHMPDFLKNTIPGAQDAGEHFMPWAPFNEGVLEALELWYEYQLSIITKYDSVIDTLVINEPKIFANNANYRDYYNPYWWDYLTHKYGTIEALNNQYRGGMANFTDYNAGTNNEFENVIMPNAWEIDPTPLYEDYMDFNETLMEEFTKLVVGFAKKYAPDLKIHLKVMQHNHMNYKNYYRQGTNYEKMSKIMDVNGGDSYSNYGWADRAMTSKMAWYDYISEVDNSPIFDTETHILDDMAVIEYDDLRYWYSSGEVWNGAMHKRGAMTIWWWELNYQQQPAPIDPGGEVNSNSNLAYRPMTALANAKAMMDLQRLSYEVTALQNEKATVGLIYSRSNVHYGQDAYMKAYNEAYKDIIFSGQKVKHIYDSAPEKIQDCELLVVPLVTNVDKAMMENIKTYLDNGGKLLLVGDGNLLKDEYNRPHDKVLVDYIYNHANTDTSGDIMKKIRDMELSDVVLVNADTNEPVDNIEWMYTEYNGNILLNMMDYVEDASHNTNIKILYKGKEITQYKDLRDDVDMSGTLNLKSFRPMLLQFAK